VRKKKSRFPNPTGWSGRQDESRYCRLWTGRTDRPPESSRDFEVSLVIIDLKSGHSQKPDGFRQQPIYGDASRRDILKAAEIEKAGLSSWLPFPTFFPARR